MSPGPGTGPSLDRPAPGGPHAPDLVHGDTAVEPGQGRVDLRGRSWSLTGRPLERHRLCAPLDLLVPAGAQRGHRRAGQRVVVCEEPAQDLVVAVAAVAEHR